MTVRVQLVLAGLERRRPEHVSIEVGFRWFLRDREIAGGVLGGGLAYRLFFWGLALTLLTCGGLGVAASSGSNIDTAMKDSGLTSAVADIVASAAQQSEAERWWLLAVGAYSTLWFGWSFLRSLRLVHAAAWRVTLPRLRNAPLALAAVLAAPCVLALLSVAAGWVPARGRRRHRGCSPTLGAGVLFGFAWFVVSVRLPAADGVPPSAFVPGAVVFGVGLEALHVLTVYFLANKLASASDLYGVLGLATTTLFYLYLVGRGIIWAAELNAVVWTVRRERESSPEDR